MGQTANTSNIRGYGCWCSMASHFRNGQGPVQNPLDENCKMLHLGYDCVKMDARDEGTTCDTTQDEYYVIPSFNVNSIDFLCQALSDALYGHLSQAKQNCAVRLCSVESRFMSWIITEFMNGGTFDFSKIHDTHGGTFNYATECMVPAGVTDRQCVAFTLSDFHITLLLKNAVRLQHQPVLINTRLFQLEHARYHNIAVIQPYDFNHAVVFCTVFCHILLVYYLS